ncbi:MAG TPA: PHB depolymerase family esterase [Pirellulales bacterium]|nr:PHB depolymerase family esterase [Pirellulales bacterium]
MIKTLAMVGCAAWLCVLAADARAAKLTLKDGRVIEGRIARLSSMAENPNTPPPAEGVQTQPIVLVDDDLRRTFIPRFQIAAIDEKESSDGFERIALRQPVAHNGARVGMVGQILEVSPFDEFGRRVLKMRTSQGVLPVIQGITLLTPEWTKVEALQQDGKSLVWEQRIATSSIPPSALEKILNRLFDSNKIDQRLTGVRFYLQSERYKDAEERLKQIIADFPEGKDQYQPTVVRLRQAYARRILAEAKIRRAAGQHQLAYSMLEHFPPEDVAGETLVAVRELLDQYAIEIGQTYEVMKHFDDDLAQVKDSAYGNRLNEIRDELAAELNLNTLPRMAAYRQFWDDPNLQPEDRLALAISGWLVGSNDAMRRLPTAMALVDTRNLMRRYFVEPVRVNRDTILAQAKSNESATPAFLAKLADHMKPPLGLGAPIASEPGLYRHEIEAVNGEPAHSYTIQLPPEYDPYRSYPTIVTLHGAGSTAEQQIEWWAGTRDPASGMRLGQATRNGYIVIAPAWAKPEQNEYAYSAREHGAVLNSLRDACRRYAIDTDRVFLSGHSIGGDAAWDIALAHPDLWAGVIPITAVADRYVAHYWENAKYVPFYLVCGEYDGDKSVKNARDLDRYMKWHYNVTVVEYQGRGHEHFSDEVQRLFDWMSRFQRNFFPREFKCRSMRSWDNFFWWVEMRDLPAKTIVEPEQWPPQRNTIAAITEATLTATNGAIVKTAAASVTLWLSPEMLNFAQPVRLLVNGQRPKPSEPFVHPDLTVMLEDIRTRGDRRHPFWAKVEMPGGRVNVAGP